MEYASQPRFCRGAFVIVDQGRLKGKRGIVIEYYPDGTDSRSFPHALIVGFLKSPRPIKPEMPEHIIEQRSTMRVFRKILNTNHLILTRYVLSEELFRMFNVKLIVESSSEKDEGFSHISAVFKHFYRNNLTPTFFGQ